MQEKRVNFKTNWLINIDLNVYITSTYGMPMNAFIGRPLYDRRYRPTNLLPFANVIRSCSDVNGNANSIVPTIKRNIETARKFISDRKFNSNKSISSFYTCTVQINNNLNGCQFTILFKFKFNRWNTCSNEIWKAKRENNLHYCRRFDKWFMSLFCHHFAWRRVDRFFLMILFAQFVWQEKNASHKYLKFIGFIWFWSK